MKAFAMMLDAVVCLIILVSLPSFAHNDVSLNDQLLYQQAQDIVEVCTILGRLDESCFGYTGMSYCLNDCSDAMIERDYVSFSLLPN